MSELPKSRADFTSFAAAYLCADSRNQGYWHRWLERVWVDLAQLMVVNWLCAAATCPRQMFDMLVQSKWCQKIHLQGSIPTFSCLQKRHSAAAAVLEKVVQTRNLLRSNTQGSPRSHAFNILQPSKQRIQACWDCHPRMGREPSWPRWPSWSISATIWCTSWIQLAYQHTTGSTGGGFRSSAGGDLWHGIRGVLQILMAWIHSRIVRTCRNMSELWFVSPCFSVNWKRNFFNWVCLPQELLVYHHFPYRIYNGHVILGQIQGPMAWYSSHGLELFPLQNGWLNDAIYRLKISAFKLAKWEVCWLYSPFFYTMLTQCWHISLSILSHGSMGFSDRLPMASWPPNPLIHMATQDCLDQASYLIARGDEAWSCEQYDSLCITLMT